MTSFRDHKKRLAALEARTQRDIGVVFTIDNPPRYILNGRDVDAATFAAQRPSTVIVVRYEGETDQWHNVAL